jgi:hypothetical protein
MKSVHSLSCHETFKKRVSLKALNKTKKLLKADIKCHFENEDKNFCDSLSKISFMTALAGTAFNFSQIIYVSIS